MKTPTHSIPSNHRRSLSVTARTVEGSLDEMEQLLNQRGVKKFTSTVHPSYSAEERAFILETIRDLRKTNEEMVKALGLKSDVKNEEQIIRAQIAHLWTILIDSTSHGMRGFGELPSETAHMIDQHVEQLLKILNRLL